MYHIVDNIYIGGIDSLDDPEVTSMSQIISLVKHDNVIDKVTMYLIPFTDDPKVCVIPFCKQIYALLKGGKPSLVHCQQGKSGSVVVVIFYLMRKYRFTFAEAYYHVKQNIPEIQLNKGFHRQLSEIKHV